MATFGQTSNGASSSTVVDADGDNLWTSSATPSSSGIVVSLTSRFHVTAGSVNVRGVVFSDNAGEPDSLLAVTDDGNFTNTSEQENTLNFSGANLISIVSGTPYWVGLHWESPAGGDLVLSRDATANLRRVANGDTFSGGTATPISAPVTTLSGPVDAYITYTETGNNSGLLMFM
jgi:hypothetical protein